MTEWQERRSAWVKKSNDARSEWDIDYGRVVHSASFRRLQGKTQILNLGDSDFYRTRLTHSIEVAQIATSLTRQLGHDEPEHPARQHLPEFSLIQAVGSTHDLGHPPFGHGGEIALNYCMRNDGGFEGNGQTLRILSRLEKFSPECGSNLTRRTLLGTLKYPVAFGDARGDGVEPSLVEGTTTVKLLDRTRSKPPKCYMDTERDVVDWILKPLDKDDRREFASVLQEKGKHGVPKHKSFDCSIMDLSDDISFGVHDLEDVIALGLLGADEFRTGVADFLCAEYLRHCNQTYDEFVLMLFGDGGNRKRAINRLVGYFILHCRLETREELQDPLIRFRGNMREEGRAFLNALTHLVRDRVIFSAEVQHLEFKGQQMVIAVFEALKSEPNSFLPRDARDAYSRSDGAVRVICDHVAGMTDAFLLRTYERLYSPRMGSVFDKL